MQTQQLLDHVLFSWKTSAVGLLSAVYAIAQPFIHNDTTLAALFHDQAFVMALIAAAIGFLSKDATAHGTPSAPIDKDQAAQIAAVAASMPPAVVSFVGDPLNGSALVFGVKTGDPTPIGDTVTDPRGNFKKVAPDVYEKV